MTDLELTRLCAEALGGNVTHEKPRGRGGEGWIRIDGSIFNPLHDDAQAMALVKKLHIEISYPGFWRTIIYTFEDEYFWAESTDLNLAIVECVAAMQAQKGAAK